LVVAVGSVGVFDAAANLAGATWPPVRTLGIRHT
jgi:hypothetical protein